MNREFLEELYRKQTAINTKRKALSEQNTFCAEKCPQCDKAINSNYHEHIARVDEVDEHNTTINALLDLYWQTHNGGDK